MVIIAYAKGQWDSKCMQIEIVAPVPLANAFSMTKALRKKYTIRRIKEQDAAVCPVFVKVAALRTKARIRVIATTVLCIVAMVRK